MESSARSVQTIRIEPLEGYQRPRLRELWEYRDLIYFLVRRDIAIRYKQSAVGALWAVLQPVLLGIVFSVFLGSLAKVPSEEGIPYPVFALSGMVMWLYFASSSSLTSTSTVANAELISKVYFPRIIIPLAASLQPVLDFAIGVVVVIVAMLIYGVAPAPQVVLIPLIVPVSLAVALGLGLWLSALHVRYRDVQVIVPFAIQVGLFITPIIYPFDLVPDNLQPLYAINPMVGVLELYRWMLFAEAPWPGAIVAIPFVAGLVLLYTGARFFQRAERSFADVI